MLVGSGAECRLPLSLSRRTALWHPQDLDFLLQRCVIEILDVRRLLLTPASPASAVPGQIALERPAPGKRGWVIPRSAQSHEPASTPRTRDLLAPVLDATFRGLPQPARQSWELEQRARTEARLLVRHLDLVRHRHTDSHAAGMRCAIAPMPVPVLFQPATFEEAVSYLQCVASACRRERWRRTPGRLWPARDEQREEERQYA